MASQSVKVISLDNLASAMPPWQPNLPNHLFALVDMGSNGIRFSISDLSPPRSRLLKCLYRERAAISLFDALNESPGDGPQEFSKQVIHQVSQALARFKSICNSFGVPPTHISVFATEAMRKAANASEMEAAIQSSSALDVYILAPKVEALLGAMGARSAFTHANGLFLDLGGGSVQMSYMNSLVDAYEISAAETGQSLPFGAAKLIKILKESDSTAHATVVDDLKTKMGVVFEDLQQKFPDLKESQCGKTPTGVDVYLCGGGFRGYGSILMHNDPIQPYPIPAVGAYTVDRHVFDQTETLRTCNAEYGGKIFGMSKRRRQQFPAIAAVVEALLRTVPEIRTVTFCSGGNREGALLLKLPKSLRESCPLPLIREPNCGFSQQVLKSLVALLQSALPTDIDTSKITTIFSLGLGPLFASKIWLRTGEPSEANAAFELHQAITRDPSVPGLTHLARAVLGLTLCFRWGASLGPIDEQLYNNLRELVKRADPDANFWIEYLGAVAVLLSKVFPVAPEDPEVVDSTMRLNATSSNGKKRRKIHLSISLSSRARQAIDPEELVGLFPKIGKHDDDIMTAPGKVEVSVDHM